MPKATGGGNYNLSDLRIRKLTPKECYRLMGFSDNDYKAAKSTNASDSTLYHQAGDSIITTCLMALIGQMLPISEEDLQQKIENYVESIVKEN